MDQIGYGIELKVDKSLTKIQAYQAAILKNSERLFGVNECRLFDEFDSRDGKLIESESPHFMFRFN